MPNKGLMKLKNKFLVEYRDGVSQFLELAKYPVDNYEWTRCPCKRCMNSIWDSLKGVKRHLLTIGISPSCTGSVYHGEPVNLHRGTQKFDKGTSSNLFSEENEILGMLLKGWKPLHIRRIIKPLPNFN